jgi:hypothetical protein
VILPLLGFTFFLLLGGSICLGQECLPQRLKPDSGKSLYRSAKALRRPKAEAFSAASIAADAGYLLLVDVQISHFVTKVLIRKRFREASH